MLQSFHQVGYNPLLPAGIFVFKGDKIFFKSLTQEVVCQITEIKKVLDSTVLEEHHNKDEINFREAADIIIKTDRDIVAETFINSKDLGKFVLERADVCCGGIIKRVY